jgi:hypothetical protein
VTEAGAGGRVATIMEALIEDGSAVAGVLDTLDNGTILAWVEKNRPDLAEALKAGKKVGSTKNDPDEKDETEEAVQELLSSGKAKTRADALALVKAKKVKESTGGDEVADVTPEALTEALASDEGKSVLGPIIANAVVEAVRELDLGREVVSVVEARLEQDREVIRAEAEAHADRRNELRDMRDHAHRRISESKLSERLKKHAQAKFDLVEGTPTTGLNLVNDEDADGKVEKSAVQKLDEAIDAEIREGLEVMAELNPTRVRGQGSTTLTESGGGKGKEGEGEGEGEPDRVGPTTRTLLEGIGVTGKAEDVYSRDLDTAYIPRDSKAAA